MADQKRNQRMELLNAIAEGGTAGGDAYQQAISSAQNGKVQGLKLAGERANAISAPEEFIARQAGIIAQPADTAVPLLQAQQGAANAYRGALNSAQGQYMAGVGQSRNLLDTLAQKSISNVDAQAKQDAMEQVQRMVSSARTMRNQEDEDMNKQNKAAQKLAKQQAYEALDLTPDERDTVQGLIQRNGGLAGAYDELEEAGVDVNDPAFAAIRDRLLFYYEPELYQGEQVGRNSVATPQLQPATPAASPRKR